MIDTIRHMTNDKFVEFCYTSILGREGDEEGRGYSFNIFNL